MKFIYKPPHGYFRGYADKVISPCVNASAWCDNTFLVSVNVAIRYCEPCDTPYLNGLRERGIRLPAILCQIRTDEGRVKRKQGIEVFRYKFLTPRTDGISNTLTGVTKDNLIMVKANTNMEDLTYHEHPTKEDLLEYFGQRIRIRKMTPVEALRLMDVDDADIRKMQEAGIAKTQLYKLAGNSIVVSCLYHIFRTLFVSRQPENKTDNPIQTTLF